MELHPPAPPQRPSDNRPFTPGLPLKTRGKPAVPKGPPPTLYNVLVRLIFGPTRDL
jgi:hypothetical protein